MINQTKNWLVFMVLTLLFTMAGASENQRPSVETHELNIKQIENNHRFYGLASYYDSVNYYIIDKNSIVKLNESDTFKLNSSQWLTAVGRLNVLVIKNEHLSGRLIAERILIENSAILTKPNSFKQLMAKSELASLAPELDQIRYYHLWPPLAWLSKLIESILVTMQSYLISDMGIVIVIFAIFLKIILLPIGIMTTNFQRRVSQVQSLLAPKLAEIKANYDGEEAHNRLMLAHKELGVSPFFTLKPMLGSFIQIPILIATFNALGEMSQFAGQSFLWVKDLAYPDAMMQLPMIIPMFGETLNILPFLMTVVTIYSTIVFQNKHALDLEVKKQKRNLYFMAFAFFILFYPFPAVMVLYWALANILQYIQQKYVEI